MSQKERTGWRDLRYSAWHRKVLPHWTYLMDADWWEYGFYNGELVILFYYELKSLRPDGTFPEVEDSQWKIIKYHQERGITAAVVWYSFDQFDEPISFYLQESPNAPRHEIPPIDWIQFIKDMHKPQFIKQRFILQRLDDKQLWMPSKKVWAPKILRSNISC